MPRAGRYNMHVGSLCRVSEWIDAESLDNCNQGRHVACPAGRPCHDWALGRDAAAMQLSSRATLAIECLRKKTLTQLYVESLDEYVESLDEM